MKFVKGSHSCFVLQSQKGSRIVVDPGKYSESEVSQLRGADAVVYSHQHADHFDVTLLELLECNQIVLPADIELSSEVSRNAVVQRIAQGEHVAVLDFDILPFCVDHGTKLSRPIENFGFLISADGRSVMYTGDMAAPSQLPQVASAVELIVVPTGGGGFVFDADQAAAFLRSLGYRGTAVPCHDCGSSDRDGAVKLRDLAAGDFIVRVLGTGDSIEVAS
jgi:L-ascorbate metabolism protein UlaG (beta-lactamase superfamily)